MNLVEAEKLPAVIVQEYTPEDIPEVGTATSKLPAL
jgi:hypothetical protein